MEARLTRESDPHVNRSGRTSTARIMPDEPDIILDRRGAAGLITLNRPAALNAVNLGMVRTLRDALERWRHDETVSRVVVAAAGGRAFSAGGDLRAIYQAAQAGRQRESRVLWGEG
jgi:enoyl-CoA hydratase